MPPACCSVASAPHCMALSRMRPCIIKARQTGPQIGQAQGVEFFLLLLFPFSFARLSHLAGVLFVSEHQGLADYLSWSGACRSKGGQKTDFRPMLRYRQIGRACRYRVHDTNTQVQRRQITWEMPGLFQPHAAWRTFYRRFCQSTHPPAACTGYLRPGLTKPLLHKLEMELIFDTLRASYSVQTVPCQPVSCTIGCQSLF